MDSIEVSTKNSCFGRHIVGDNQVALLAKKLGARIFNYVFRFGRETNDQTRTLHHFTCNFR